MSLRFLLDTNVVSEPIRPAPNLKLLRQLELHAGAAGIAAPTWHELKLGCERLPRSRRRKQIEDYLATVIAVSYPVLPYDGEAAAWHARERSRLLAEGRSPAFVDGQIAAIASVNGLVLVTANQPDFAFFKGLQLDNWLR